jgi:hypothetical protein
MVKRDNKTDIRVVSKGNSIVSIDGAETAKWAQCPPVGIPSLRVPDLFETFFEKISHDRLVCIFNNITGVYIPIGHYQSCGSWDIAVLPEPVYPLR